jgi:hypothetical protein
MASTKIGDVTISVDGPYVVVGRDELGPGGTASGSFSPSSLATILVICHEPGDWFARIYANELREHWESYRFDTRDEAEVFAGVIRRAAIEAGQWRRG